MNQHFYIDFSRFLFSFFFVLRHFYRLFRQRMDLGECPKVHDLALRADYEKAAKHKDYYYDIDVSMRPNKPLFFVI